MARTPVNVLVLPYKKEGFDLLFCIFKRKDVNIWQFVAGGGEDGETLIETAIRETYEETGIISDDFIQLKSMTYAPVGHFSEKSQVLWGKETIVVPIYTFAVLCKSTANVTISDEHTNFKWCSFDEAMQLLHFDLDKTAMYELNEMHIRNLLIKTEN